MAHEKELILNKHDTNNMIKMIEMTRGIVDNFNKIRHFPQSNQKGGGNSYHVNFHVNGTLTKNDANGIGRQFLDFVKRNGG